MEAPSQLGLNQSIHASQIAQTQTTEASTTTAQTTLDAKVQSAAQGSLNKLTLLFDPATNDVFIIHADSKIANPEVAAKVEKLKERALNGDQTVNSLNERLLSSKQDQKVEARVAAKLEMLMQGARVEDGKVVLSTAIGEYKLGISPEALETVVRVSVLTADIAQDRILSVFEPHTTGTHDFYQLHTISDATPSALLHMHNGHRLGRGAEGDVYKALDLVGKQARVVKLNVGGEDAETKMQHIQTEDRCAGRVNPSNSSPGLAHKPIRIFNLDRPGSGGIGLVQRFYEKGTLLSAIVKEIDGKATDKDKLSLKDKMKGIQALFQGAKSLSIKNVLHLDIKLDNVFMTANKEMVIADFDQVWDLESPEILVARIETNRIPESSPNVLPHEYKNKFDQLGKAMLAKHNEIEQLKESKAEAKPKEQRIIEAKIAKAEQELTNLFTSYKKVAEFAHAWSVAYLALQLITGKPQKWADKTDVLLKELDSKIQTLSGPQNAVEKQFLLQMKTLLEPILKAPCPSETTNKKSELQPASSTVNYDIILSTLNTVTDLLGNALEATGAKRSSTDSPEREKNNKIQFIKV